MALQIRNVMNWAVHSTCSLSLRAGMSSASSFLTHRINPIPQEAVPRALNFLRADAECGVGLRSGAAFSRATRVRRHSKSRLVTVSVNPFPNLLANSTDSAILLATFGLLSHFSSRARRTARNQAGTQIDDLARHTTNDSWARIPVRSGHNAGTKLTPGYPCAASQPCVKGSWGARRPFYCLSTRPERPLRISLQPRSNDQSTGKLLSLDP
jgi:hypothetical protein